MRATKGQVAGCLAALTLGAGAVPAAAQQAVHQGVAVPRGIDGATRSVDVLVGVNAGYDSNVLRTSSASAATLGLEKEDFTLEPGVAVNVTLPFSRNLLTVEGDARYRINANNSSRDGERIGLSGILSSNLGRCSTDVGAGIRRARTDIGNFDPVSVGAGLIDNFETEYQVGATLACGAAVGISPFVGVGYAGGRNSETLREISNYDSVAYGGGLIYSQPSLGEIGVVGSIVETEYPDRPLTGPLVISDFSARSIGLYFNRAVARTVQASVQINYTDVEAGTTGIGYDGLSGNVSIRVSPSGSAVIEFLGARAVGASLTYVSDFRIETVGEIRVTAPLGPKLTAIGSAKYGNNEYKGAPLIGGVTLRDEDVGELLAGLNYNLSPSIRLGVGAGYRWRSANDPFFDYDSVQVTASIGMVL